MKHIRILLIVTMIPLIGFSAVSSTFQRLSKGDLEKVIHLHGKVIKTSDSSYQLATQRRIFELDKKGIDELNQLDNSRIKNREVFKVKLAHIIGISNAQKK